MRLALLVILASAAAHADGMTQVREGDSASFDPQSIYKVPRGESPAVGPVDHHAPGREPTQKRRR